MHIGSKAVVGQPHKAVQIPIPDVTAEISPNISFKTEGDRQAIVEILEGEYSEVKKFNEAPALEAARKAELFEEVERQRRAVVRAQGYRLVYIPTTFENKALTEEEKREKIDEHLENCRKINDVHPKKPKIQHDKKGDSVQKFGLHIDPSKSQYQPADAVSTGKVSNLVQGTVELEKAHKGHWARPRNINSVKVYRTSQDRDRSKKHIHGQHNFNRQRDPNHPDEQVLGTRLMNLNPKHDEFVSDKIDMDAKTMRFGTVRKVKNTSYWDDIFAAAATKALGIVAPTISTAQSTSAKAESKQDFAGKEVQLK